MEKQKNKVPKESPEESGNKDVQQQLQLRQHNAVCWVNTLLMMMMLMRTHDNNEDEEEQQKKKTKYYQNASQ